MSENTLIDLPDFPCTLVTQNDKGEFIETKVSLLEYTKTHTNGLILYFYPKDNTAGCTVQATDFSADFEKFLALGYNVIGVSRDSIKSHQNFISKHGLKIDLISDDDERLCRYFDVIKEKNMYGKKVLGIQRSTFVFDKTGKPLFEFRNIKAKGHSEFLLKTLA